MKTDGDETRFRWMIYGANGYTGELIAREAVARGEKPILAGRSAAKIEPLARELQCEWRAFDLAQPDLSGVALVLHCAGPFIHTSKAMVRACLDAGVHYTDITGEIAVFEAVMRRNEEAVQRGVTLLPGAGFDVVPTDCLAAMLHERLSDATELWLGINPSRAGASRGTLKTILEGLGRGGAIRRDGKIVVVPHAYDVREIPFASGPRLAMTIPWGDVSTAFHTTGIPNIRVYQATPPRVVKRLRRLRPLLPLMNLGPVKRFAQKRVDKHAGPSAEEREKGRVYLWGRVANARGEEVTMSMTVREGYRFTVLSSIAAVRRILDGGARPGSFTPARLFGAEFVMGIDGTEVQ
ncbi:MAG TPA: saccharopine dehydrogenase NADP-binding domain-containing protein [Thermoanaerobaculia bacterium]|nr:saccharopine dehydrogenase NADP-binding domain-containing protein [Thermoanaerobaculia bacterium]